MKLNLLILVIFLFGNIAVSCQNKKANESGAEGSASGETGKTANPSFPFLSSQEVNTLYSLAEKVDIIFYNLPISVNQDDPGSAKNTVLYVAPAAPNISSHCEPVGRLSWIVNGKIFREADFYVGEGCNHFVFIENGQPVYKNAMAPEGVQFFQTIMSQVRPPDKK